MPGASKLERALSGLVAAMVTPYRDDLSVDLDVAGELAEWLVDGGVDGILVAGTTGELGLLRPSETAALAGRVAEAAGDRAAVIAGVRGENPWEVAEAARAVLDSGAEAVLVPPPCYHRGAPSGLVEFYSRLAETVDAPLILYNIPSRVCAEIPPDIVGRLAGEHSNIVALKATTETPWYVAEVRRHAPKLPVLAGLDEAVILALNYGASGAVLASANVVPASARRLLGSWIQGQYRVALEAQDEIEEVMWALRPGRSLQGAIKAALSFMGLNVKPLVRPPLPPEDAESLSRIKERLERLGLA